jgi:hypothetical protein
MSTIKVDTVRPVTTDGSLTLQGDSSGSGVTGLVIDSTGTVTTGTLGSGVVFPAGHVIQVAQTTDSTDYSNSTTTPDQATQTSTFTLTNSSNKVLVTVNCLVRSSKSTVAGANLAIYRGPIVNNDRITSGSAPLMYISDPGTEFYLISTLQYLDTPGGSTTYSLGFWKHPSASLAEIKGSFFQTIILLQEISV